MGKAMTVVMAVHPADRYARAGHGRVNELRVTDVNANVREFAAARIEKHQVAGRELFATDRFSPA